MSLLKLIIVGLIIVCIVSLGGMVVLAIIGSLVVPFVEWLEKNPILRGVFSIVGLALIIVLFLVFSKWVLRKAVE